MIVVDTNVASELMRPYPSEAVVSWLGRCPVGEMFTTAITLAEVRYGIERLPDGGRKELLALAAAEVFGRFEDKVLPFDAAAAGEYARVASQREAAGSPIEGFDAQIAAICRVHGAALATRNVKDFMRIGIDLIDPWLA